jgi:hypothetical protein
MISQTAAYMVPFDALKRAVGSRDHNLLKAIKKDRARLLEEADDNRDDDDSRTCAEALADLINGANLDAIEDSEGNIYGLALEAMCAQLGQFVGEIQGDWNDPLDAFFAARGVPLMYSDLVFGDAVIVLPVYAGYPEVGSWTPDSVVAAAAPLRAIDLESLRQENEEMAKVVGEIGKWIDTASKRPGWGIVGFSL